MKKTKATGKAAENRQTESKAADEARVEEEIRQLRERLVELNRRLKKIETYR